MLHLWRRLLNTKDNNCSQKEEWECSSNSPCNYHPKRMGCRGGPCILTSCNRCICNFRNSRLARISKGRRIPKVQRWCDWRRRWWWRRGSLWTCWAWNKLSWRRWRKGRMGGCRRRMGSHRILSARLDGWRDRWMDGKSFTTVLYYM